MYYFSNNTTPEMGGIGIGIESTKSESKVQFNAGIGIEI